MKRAAWVLAMVVATVAAYSQYTITGITLDEEKQSLPGANLVINELNRGTVSSSSGEFSITETRKLSDTNKFTIAGENIDFLGYKDQSGTIDTYNFNATGAEVCNYLTYIDKDYKNYDGTYTYSTDGVPICDDKSGINMKLYYLEE